MLSSPLLPGRLRLHTVGLPSFPPHLFPPTRPCPTMVAGGVDRVRRVDGSVCKPAQGGTQEGLRLTHGVPGCGLSLLALLTCPAGSSGQLPGALIPPSPAPSPRTLAEHRQRRMLRQVPAPAELTVTAQRVPGSDERRTRTTGSTGP